MKMRKKDCLDLFRLDAGLQHSSHRADSAIDQVRTPIHDKQSRWFRAIQAQRWPAGGTQEKNFSAVRRRSRRTSLTCA